MTVSDGFKTDIKKTKKTLNTQRFKHCLSVEKTAIHLAKIYRISHEKIALAGLLHDCAKWMNNDQILKQAKKSGLKIDPFMKIQPKLLHGPLSAHFAKVHFGIKDEGILTAIKNHTSGRPNMTKLEKIIYLADHIEPGRKYKNVKKIRKIAFTQMDKAIALIAGEMLQYLLDKGLSIYPRTVLTRNYYLKYARK